MKHLSDCHNAPTIRHSITGVFVCTMCGKTSPRKTKKIQQAIIEEKKPQVLSAGREWKHKSNKRWWK